MQTHCELGRARGWETIEDDRLEEDPTLIVIRLAGLTIIDTGASSPMGRLGDSRSPLHAKVAHRLRYRIWDRTEATGYSDWRHMSHRRREKQTSR